MIERGKISSIQMAVMMNPTILATVLMLVPAITAKHAKQDLWLSPIWASVTGFIIVYIAYRFHKLYPKETLIQFSELILGKVIGKIIAASYLLFYMHITGIITREYGEFVSGTFLHLTPMVVVLGSMVMVSAFAVYGGLEVIGRCAEIIVPVVTLLYLTIFVLLFKDLDMSHMFPILENGLAPSLLGSIVPQCWFSEYFLISFFLPYLTDQEKGLKWGMISVFSVMLIMVITNIMTLLLLGKLNSVVTYPVMIAARYISIADFFEHLEAVVMAIWVAGAFVKITVFYYVLVLGMAQWLKLKDFRPLVLPTGVLLVIIGQWSASSLQELSQFLSSTATFYVLSFQLGLPIILLLIALIKNRSKQMKGK
ncbi:endospore germination permease [Neobacillus cucumis]|nr:endospore germination permease [Neobacillus cucumis]